MKSYMKERVLQAASLIVNNKTIREVAEEINISKSTVHIDLIERLPRINEALAREVRNILEINIKERSIRGGEATRRKWSN